MIKCNMINFSVFFIISNVQNMDKISTYAPYPREMMKSVKSVILANVLALPPTPVKWWNLWNGWILVTLFASPLPLPPWNEEIDEMHEFWSLCSPCPSTLVKWRNRTTTSKWVNCEISKIGEMYEMMKSVKWVKSGFHYIKA